MQLKALLVKALLASVASASCIASEQGGCAEVDSKRDIEKGPVELDPAKAAGESLLDDGSFQLVRRDCRQDCENQYYKCNDDCKNDSCKSNCREKGLRPCLRGCPSKLAMDDSSVKLVDKRATCGEKCESTMKTCQNNCKSAKCEADCKTTARSCANGCLPPRAEEIAMDDSDSGSSTTLKRRDCVEDCDKADNLCNKACTSLKCHNWCRGKLTSCKRKYALMRGQMQCRVSWLHAHLRIPS
ncbi:hypothetical protein E4U54_003153 [Claviceps lovelessii]|nr:hypothetical protein E4U54_003153 [Claviceps lovelessii]